MNLITALRDHAVALKRRLYWAAYARSHAVA